MKITNPDGKINIEGQTLRNGKDITIKDIYDNSFVDYKKLIPKKKKKENDTSKKAASNLSFLTSDTWIYGNEKNRKWW
jgi:hypothetical protein